MRNVSNMNIFEKMGAVTRELPIIKKSLSISEGKKEYSALSESDVLKNVKPLEDKYRIFSYPASRKKTTRQMEKEYISSDGEKKKMILTIDDVEVTYRFVNMDNPEEYIETVSYGTGIDVGDKACGKGMTYADKYALMKAYKICGDDQSDPDSMPSSQDIMPDINSQIPTSNPMIPSVTNSSEIKCDNDGVIVSENSNGAESISNSPTLEEAKAYIVPIGSHKGKTLGEILAIDRSQVDFYGSPKFINNKYPELKCAAQVILKNIHF